ncbi:EcsC family protein [Rhodococcus sp. IEGM 1408]|uniref:EcsC family protein n=1 Tax=Rhodococcus sp. IEGM 1408 TaxID=3082220 RepID=UPI002955825B|nr:EcsC family protein [Rhodococcus sp. IEGM 1408]MDV8001468.1 EcsC family protein [Rhodococcus sp. IEGM 1408]
MANAQPGRLKEFQKAVAGADMEAAATATIDFILNAGVNGFGPVKSAKTIADEALKHSANDREKAIKRVVATHTRVVGASGFVSGLGGLATMAVAIPADVTVFYTRATRMIAAVAHLRGYDVDSEEVRSIIAVSLIGSAGVEAMSKAGVEIGTKTAVAALKKLPGSVLVKINKAVGYRLVTKFGTKGSINLVKVVPVAGAAVGGTINIAGIRSIAGYAKLNFPAVEQVTVPGTVG